MIYLCAHEEYALFAARYAFGGRPFRSVEAPEAAVPVDGGLFVVPTPVYLLTLSTSAAIEKFVTQAQVDAVIGVPKPALLRALPNAEIYDEPQVKAQLKTLLGAAFASWAPLRREALQTALPALPWMLDLVACGRTPTADDLRGVLSDEDAETVFAAPNRTPPRVSVLPGDDYGLLCFETEKLLRAYLRDANVPHFARKAQALHDAKVRCKRGAGRPFLYG